MLATRDGRSWTPRYLDAIDGGSCIGCGRCFKVCGQGVLALRGLTEDGALVDVDDDDEEIERKVMTLADRGACIGCAACARVCGSKAQSFASAA